MPIISVMHLLLRRPRTLYNIRCPQCLEEEMQAYGPGRHHGCWMPCWKNRGKCCAAIPSTRVGSAWGELRGLEVLVLFESYSSSALSSAPLALESLSPRNGDAQADLLDKLLLVCSCRSELPNTDNNNNNSSNNNNNHNC